LSLIISYNKFDELLATLDPFVSFFANN
jgi:hypothetical protein